MKAVAIHRHGGLEELQYGDYPTPEPGSGQVRVRVKACALNHLDIFVREGWKGLKLSLPHIPGCDVAGVVDEFDPGISGMNRGAEVVVNPSLFDGTCEYCLRGEESLCVDYKILGEHVNGGYAECVVVPARNILPKPPHLSFPEAAAIPLVFMTAWRMLVRRAQVRPGEDVLVVGASGGVASAAIQIAKVMGARVFAASRSLGKLARARELGADVLLDESEGDFSEAIWKATGKRGVDVVVENVGEATWAKSLRSLARGGRLVTCGATTGPMAEVDLRVLFWRQLSLLGSTMGSRADLQEVLRLVEARRLRPVVDTVMPLAKAREAQARLEGGEQFGKIVLVP